MQITWLGHSAFLITSDSGIKIVTDPYEPGGYDGAIKHGALTHTADVITVSHDHPDHNYTEMVPGNPIVLRGAGRFVASGIEFEGVNTAHDASGGDQRGKNTVFTFVVDGIKIAHLGDLGHVLTNDQAAEIGKVDVLLTPVGGHFTIGPEEAQRIVGMLTAKIVIPMHYRTEKVDFPIGGVDDFIKDCPSAERLDSATLTLAKSDITDKKRVVVLKYAL